MTLSQLRMLVSKRLRKLSKDRLEVADDFLAYLEEREDNAATRELLTIPGFKIALKRAEHQAVTGKTVKWSRVRRDV